MTTITVGQIGTIAQAAGVSSNYVTAAKNTSVSGSAFVIGIATVEGSSSSTAWTATDNFSNSYTKLTQQKYVSGGATYMVDRFYCANGTGGTGHEATAVGANQPGALVVLIELPNAALTSLYGAPNATDYPYDATGPYTTSLAVTPPSGGIFLLAALGVSGSTAPTIAESTGFTIIGQQNNTSGGGSAVAFAYKIVTAAGTDGPSFTSTAGDEAFVTIDSFLGTNQNVVLVPSGTSLTLNTTNLPGYNGLIDKIECIGGGGSGLSPANASTNCPGGGGGAYALSTAVSIALNTSVTMQIGAGAAAEGTAGTDTWFNGASLAASSCGAKGGGGATGTAAGAGGASGSCIISGSGSVAYSGGNGGANGVTGTSGGGGAGGPLGVGGAGGLGSSTSSAGGGGGGNGGGSAGAAGTTNGGAGGNNNASSGGGAAGTSTVAAVAGTNGGGGGGAAGSGPGTGANGAEGTEWTLTAGGTAGSGGGGGGGVIGNLSGNGAVGGGGGAGGGTTSAGFGTGGNGFIVLTYTPSGGGVVYTPFNRKIVFVNDVNVQF